MTGKLPALTATGLALLACLSAPLHANELRIVCQGEAQNARVWINGGRIDLTSSRRAPYSPCSTTVKGLARGKHSLQVSKTFANGTYRIFQRDIELTDDGLTVTVTPALMKAPTQTEAETTAWILSKLRQYMPGQQRYSARDDSGQIKMALYSLDLSIENGMMYASWKELWPAWRDGRYSGPERTVTQRYKLSVHAIQDARALYDTFPGMELITESRCPTCSNFNDRGGRPSNYWSGRAHFFMTNQDHEENFEQRFHNAIMHLKSFHPAPAKPQEAF